MAAPRFIIEDIRLFERDVVLRLPFRFGAATVTACPQAFVHLRIRTADGRTGWGSSAEMMVPKWFDKNPALSHKDNFNQLRAALKLARAAYITERSPLSAFGHFAARNAELREAGGRIGLNPLTAAYGPALIDRAALDALCLLEACSAAEALSTNLPGIDVSAYDLAPDLVSFDMPEFLRRQRPVDSIAARHTVGMADALRHADAELFSAEIAAIADGLPLSLEAAISRYGHRHFKLKLGGDVQTDLARLRDIAEVIGDRAEVITLDGNEQYQSTGDLLAFLQELQADPALDTLKRTLAFVEQPLPRDMALETNVHEAAALVPLLIDESDGTLGAFVKARAQGYTGVSSKSCKGLYKSVFNAARCALWTAAEGKPYFLSGEDLTMQAGVGVQQDLCLVGWLGLAHVERNGHHYVDGLASAPRSEQRALLQMHPDLYEDRDGAVRLAIRDGRIDLRRLLRCPGLGTATPEASLDWNAMRELV